MLGLKLIHTRTRGPWCLWMTSQTEKSFLRVLATLIQSTCVMDLMWVTVDRWQRPLFLNPNLTKNRLPEPYFPVAQSFQKIAQSTPITRFIIGFYCAFSMNETIAKDRLHVRNNLVLLTLCVLALQCGMIWNEYIDTHIYICIYIFWKQSNSSSVISTDLCHNIEINIYVCIYTYRCL